ncbi:MAG: FecR domain-containing protein [Verrucomicrobia bacterium]|nr:FecR domain-containing protein [Verrucomicrobiota bacterium]
MNSADNPFDDRAQREAARWLARQDRGLTAAEQDEFLQWLAADPRHGAWLARHREGWTRLDAIAAWRPQHGAEPNPDVLAQPARHRWWSRPVVLAAAAALALLAGGLAWRLSIATRASSDHTTPVATGGYERRTLEDGSTVELTGGAELEVSFTAAERRITLRRGEALFTVAKNPARPFMVRAGGVNVRAVGTAFNVRLESTHVAVLVTEGRVQVTPPAPSASAPPPAPTVDAGEFAEVSLAASSTPKIGPAPDAERARLQAWQPQLLEFAATPLADVVAELNRRNRRQLVLTDPALGRITIGASIRSDNLDGFVQLLATTARLRAENQGDYHIVLRAGP